MKFRDYIKNGAWKGSIGAVGMKLMAARPELLLIGGGISLFVGTIYACTKSVEGKKAIDEHKEAIKETENKVYEGDEKHQKIARGRDYVKNYGNFAYKLVKIYGIPALLWFGGMGMIVGAHGELRKTNAHLIADSVAAKKLFDEYRGRVAKAVGDETEQRIFMGVQEGVVNVLEKDEKTGEDRVVQKKTDIFYSQPGSIFARNFNEETSDAFDIRSFADYYLDCRIDAINKNLSLGVKRAYTGLEILRELGFNENALGEGESVDALISNGISGNARRVTNPEDRQLKVTRMRGYQKKWDVVRDMEVYVPCLRLDFNFYPLAGKI